MYMREYIIYIPNILYIIYNHLRTEVTKFNEINKLSRLSVIEITNNLDISIFK